MAERVKRRGLVVIISDLLDDPEKVIAGLKHFRHRNHEIVVFHVLDPFEIRFDFNRDYIFEDLETDEKLRHATVAHSPRISSKSATIH